MVVDGVDVSWGLVVRVAMMWWVKRNKKHKKNIPEAQSVVWAFFQAVGVELPAGAATSYVVLGRGGGSKWNEMGYLKKNLPGAQTTHLNASLGLFSGWQMLCGVML